MPGIKTRKTIHLLALFVAVLLLFLILVLGGVAEIVIVAALLAYIMNPIVTALEYRGINRGAAAGLILLTLAGLGVICWYTLSPIVFEQLRALQSGAESSRTSRAIADVQSFLRNRLDFLGLGRVDLPLEFQKVKTVFVEKIPGALLQGSVTFLLALVLIPFVMFFLLKDGSMMKKYFISLVPNRYFEFTMDLLYKMDLQLGNYLRGQFIDALVFGILTTIALWILGVPYFVFIGIFAGLANLIPFVGPVAGALAAMIPAVVEQGDLLRAVWVIVVFGILKLVDDFLVQPLAIGKTVKLHPMVVALGIVVAGHLFGILGMLLVVPFLGFLKVALEESLDTYRRYRFD